MCRNILLYSISLILCLFTGCEKNDGKTVYPAPAPKTEIGKKLAAAPGIMASLYSDTTYVLTPGAQVTELAFLSYTGHAMRTFFFEVDLNSENITISQTTALDKKVGSGLQPVTEQAMEVDREDFKIWGGTNSDFFDNKNGTNLPHGIFHHDGEVQKDYFNSKITRKMSFFYMTSDKKAKVALEEEYEDVVATESIEEACGAGEFLVSDGNVIMSETSVEPRTCIGVSEDAKKVYIMVVDGRRYEYSFGMTLYEIATCMKAVGAFDAVNLDGGGSSTFYVRKDGAGFDEPERFQIRNWPTDNGGQERAVANGLVIVSEK